MIRNALLLLLGSMIAASAAAADALPLRGAAMALGGPARPIRAWEVFCASPKYAQECAVDQKEPRTIALTPEIWSQIVAINRLLNRRIRARSDQEHHGQQDTWDLAEDGLGDCEDIQLLKRRRLAGLGLPYRAMRMTVVYDNTGEGHAVLTLITDRGDFVLDNKTNAVLPWQRTGYTYIKRESQDVQGWTEVGAPPSSVNKAMTSSMAIDPRNQRSKRIGTVE